ncbi:uncharacterized protein BX663DRAFT_491851 [Cokeromyces recurvatus]|uniref:uncharacterized protein n=1 Tax=Cokeromyces recurvatus TaxID=90255 RepID=UPI0022204028|nr:uncharacterized protein BX663DRAFT_491851 [Cokeromyces recurvatus]KAI7907725.1 hypothetical protein BX663DRAFT_491851 [Cokeromyces recurvatus]
MTEFLLDTDPVSNVLKRIAKERNWSEKEVEEDLSILNKNRISTINDLRSLSKESWTQIELLPLVKDLLRHSIDPEWSSKDENNKMSKVNDQVEEKEDKKKDKKKDKKEKKEDSGDKKKKKKNKGFKSPSSLGTPVVPVILNPRASSLIQELNEETSRCNLNDTVNQDHLTIQNTIRNGNTITPSTLLSSSPTSLSAQSSSDEENEEEGEREEEEKENEKEERDDSEPISPSNNSPIRRKSVSFSNETSIGIAASEKKGNNLNEKEKKKEKKKDKKDKKKDMASINKYNSSGYSSFISHPYTSHPIVKFRKMKMKHCKRLPPVPANDQFLQGIHDKLLSATKGN